MLVIEMWSTCMYLYKQKYNFRFRNEFGPIVKLSGLKLRNDIVILFEPSDFEMVN